MQRQSGPVLRAAMLAGVWPPQRRPMAPCATPSEQSAYPVHLSQTSCNLQWQGQYRVTTL
jgi:hypothetical protein